MMKKFNFGFCNAEQARKALLALSKTSATAQEAMTAFGEASKELRIRGKYFYKSGSLGRDRLQVENNNINTPV